MEIINFSQPVTGNFLVDIILWLVTTFGSVALGIVLFTVLLKLITLPFDFMSRRSMRKNSLLMEEMRPDLEKLQRQYAGNKELYNQKMMALYKKNGYSMWGSCLPTILTLVIFILAINSFTSYSQYQNKVYFYEMSKAHNSVIYEGFEENSNYVSFDENGKLIVDDNSLYNFVKDSSSEVNTSSGKLILEYKHNENGVTVKTENGFIQAKVVYNPLTEKTEVSEYVLLEDKINSDFVKNIVNDKIFAGFELDGTFIKRDANGKLVFDNLALYNKAENFKPEGKDYNINVKVFDSKLRVSTENGYVRYIIGYTLDENSNPVFDEKGSFVLLEDNLFNAVANQKESSTFAYGFETDDKFIKIENNELVFDGKQMIDNVIKSVPDTNVKVAKTDLGYTMFTENGYMQYFREVTNGETTTFNTISFTVRADELKNNSTLLNNDGKKFSETQVSAEEFLNEIAGRLSAEAYHNNKASFLWVKNIWVSDSAHEHPVLEYQKFVSTVSTQGSGCGCACDCRGACDGGVNKEVPITEKEYNRLTSQLTEERNQPNGFYILCILSAGISLVMQLVMTKSQKAQLELQTVDGQGAQSQKMMTWMMPIMMAIFSFLYTSAFSIYIIVSSIISIGTTFIINAIVDSKYKKKAPVKQVIRGRVYSPKQEEKKGGKR